MNSIIQEFFYENSKQFKYQHRTAIPDIFSSIWNQYCQLHKPQWTGMSIKMCDDDGKWEIIDRLQKEYKENKRDTFWSNIPAIADSGYINSKNNLFEIKYKDKQIGFVVVCPKKKPHSLEIITVYEGFRRKGFAEAALIAIKQYYLLVDRVMQDPQTFHYLNVNFVVEGSEPFWKEMRKKLDWLKFSEYALNKI